MAAQGVLIPDSKNMFSKNFPKPTLSQTWTVFDATNQPNNNIYYRIKLSDD